MLLDGLYLAAAMSFSGGAQSPLSFLVLVHVIAVTLLLSFRTGLKTALLHALLLFAVSWLQRAGVVAELSSDGPDQASVVRALALLAVAASAAWFSSLNESELRRGKAELRALAVMAQRMAATREPTHLVEVLIDGVATAFDFARISVVVNDRGTFRTFAGTGAGGARQVADAGLCDGAMGARTEPGGAVLTKTLDFSAGPVRVWRRIRGMPRTRHRSSPRPIMRSTGPSGPGETGSSASAVPGAWSPDHRLAAGNQAQVGLLRPGQDWPSSPWPPPGFSRRSGPWRRRLDRPVSAAHLRHRLLHVLRAHVPDVGVE